MTTAIITARAYRNETTQKQYAKPVQWWNGTAMADIVETIECSSDLPADAMGELCVTVMQKVWNAGFDPVKSRIEIRMSFASKES